MHPNATLSRQEVEAFKAKRPEHYFAYIDGAKITTWTGDELARVVWSGDRFSDNFGGTRRNFRARGINGVTYSGTAYVSAGDYVRMRAVKS